MTTAAEAFSELDKALAEANRQPCDLERVGRDAGVYFTARDLMATEFPEPRWAVPGLISEGLNLLVGSPKLGKSWLCLNLAVSIAAGGKALGKIDVSPGPVLYAALEDTPRRLQNRLQSVLGNDKVPDGLHIVTQLPKLPEAYDYLAGWVESHPGARLVIIDVLRKVRPVTDGKSSMYDSDYDSLGMLKRLADKHEIAVMVVHHTRKAADDTDVFNEVSGSTGLTGAADAILIAKRARNTADAVLHITGRDVNETEYGLTFDPKHCIWTISDAPAAVTAMAGTRRKVWEYVADHGGCTPGEVAAALDLNANTVRQTLRRMVEDNQVGTDGQGRYYDPQQLSPMSPVSPVALVSDASDSSDSGSQ